MRSVKTPLITHARVRVWILILGFKQQRKVSFDKWCCLNHKEYGKYEGILTSSCGPCKYATKRDYHVSDTLIQSLVPKIHSSFGSEPTHVLVLPLLWVAFEGERTVNGYTVTIIPPQIASDIKDCWVVLGNSPDVNPIEKIALAVQQLGDQLVIVPIRHPALLTVKV